MNSRSAPAVVSRRACYPRELQAYVTDERGPRATQAALNNAVVVKEGSFTGVASFGSISGSWTDHRFNLVPVASGGRAHFCLQIELEMPLHVIASAKQQEPRISGVIADGNDRSELMSWPRAH